MIDENYLKDLFTKETLKAKAKMEYSKMELTRSIVLAEWTLEKRKEGIKSINEAEMIVRAGPEYKNFIEKLVQAGERYDLLKAEIEGMKYRIEIERDKRISKATELKHQNLAQN